MTTSDRPSGPELCRYVHSPSSSANPFCAGDGVFDPPRPIRPRNQTSAMTVPVRDGHDCASA